MTFVLKTSYLLSCKSFKLFTVVQSKLMKQLGAELLHLFLWKNLY